MNCEKLIAWVRTRRFRIWIGLAIVAAGCTDACPSGVDSTNPEFAGDENRPADLVRTICEPYCIEITGSEYRWHVRYPDNDGQFVAQEEGPIVRNLHVPVETDVVLVLKSHDYVYTLALPKYGLKEIAVPSLEFRMAFRPPDAGRFPLLGDQLCGDPHPDLQGDLVVEPRDRFLQWLNGHQRAIENP